MKKGVQSLAEKALFYSLPVAIMGSVFKILHLSGANYLLLVGLSSISVASLIKYFLEQTPEGYATGISIALGCMAVLFKLMRWPNANLLIELTFISALTLLVIIIFFKKGNPYE